MGSHSVTRPDSYEVIGSGQVNGHGEYRPTGSSAFYPPVQNFDDSVSQPSPQFSATSFPSYWGSDVTQGSVHAGWKSYKPKKYDGSTDWTDYLKHFEIVSQWNGWSDLKKAAQLSMSMTGVARQTWSDICIVLGPEGPISEISLTWRDKGRPCLSVSWMFLGRGNHRVELQKCSYITFSPINTSKTDAFLSKLFDTYFQGLVHGEVR